MPNSKTQAVRRKHHKHIKRRKRKVKEQREAGQKKS